jgi:DNA-binding CsgD family transcriptional regulator
VAWVLEGFASLAAVSGQPLRAAYIWGATEAIREALPAPLPAYDRQEYERDIAGARLLVDEQSFAKAWAAGKTLTFEQAVEYVLDERTEVDLPTVHIRTQPRRLEGVSVELTARELEVLRLVATGLTNAQIAEQLVLSPLTINAYLRSIYSKLGVSSRTAATRYAIDHHML